MSAMLLVDFRPRCCLASAIRCDETVDAEKNAVSFLFELLKHDHPCK
jgi:hypothetical protein